MVGEQAAPPVSLQLGPKVSGEDDRRACWLWSVADVHEGVGGLVCVGERLWWPQVMLLSGVAGAASILDPGTLLRLPIETSGLGGSSSC